MNRDDLFEWINHSISLTQATLKVSEKLLKSGYFKPEDVARYRRELAFEQSILRAERSGTVKKLTEVEHIWRWWLTCYAIIHTELWLIDSEECRILCNFARDIRDAEIERLRTERLTLYRQIRDTTRKTVQDENLTLFMNFLAANGEIKAYNRLKKEGWAKDRAKEHVAYVADLLRTGMDAKRQLEQLESI